MDYKDLVTIFGSLFAIMNPFVNLPIFLALTSQLDVKQQKSLALKITLISALMCLIIIVLGKEIIGFFGITIDQFKIAGGLVLAHIAWLMLNGQSISSHQGTAEEQKGMEDCTSLAFYPITFPIIVGPGTIATLIIYSSQKQGIEEILLVSGVVGVILLVLYVVFYFSSKINKILTNTMKVITTRLMGMILMAISVGMVVEGLKAVFSGLSA